MTIPTSIIETELRAHKAWDAALRPLLAAASQGSQDISHLAVAEAAACNAWMEAKKATDEALAATGLPPVQLGGRFATLKAMIQEEPKP